MAYVGTIISVLAAVAGTVMSVEAGKQQQKALKEQAKSEQEAARAEALVRRNELARVQAASRAHFAARGADPYTGSAFAFTSSNQRMADIDIGFMAKQRSMNAFALRQRGKAAYQQGIISGVGSAAQAGLSAGEGYSSFRATGWKG
jgi:type II secretory pathway pseudopilin PulG